MQGIWTDSQGGGAVKGAKYPGAPEKFAKAGHKRCNLKNIYLELFDIPVNNGLRINFLDLNFTGIGPKKCLLPVFLPNSMVTVYEL